MLVNLGAALIGIAMLPLLRCFSLNARNVSGAAIAVMALAILATALFGIRADGAARWISFAGFSLQASLILLPAMVVTFARARGPLATGGIMVAAIALALQPDRAMAAVLVTSLTVITAFRADRFAITALLTSLAGFAATLLREDRLPAVAYVDQIYYSSFDVHLAIGAGVIAGSLLLLVPAIVGWRRDTLDRTIYLSFGAAWGTAILAAALGNYPSPVLGYGASAIIGYALSLAALPILTGNPKVIPAN